MSRSEAPQSTFDRTAGKSIAFLVSFVTHVALMLILACLAHSMGKDSSGILLSANIGDSQESGLELTPAFDLTPTPDATDRKIEVKAPNVSLDIQVAAPESMNGFATGGLADSLESLTGNSLAGELQGGGRKKGAAFFGAYAEGNRFVYVLDSSRSMAGDRWLYACNRLIDSLNGLKEDQEFFIVCFDAETTLLFNTHPNRAHFLKPTEENIKRVRYWLRSRQLGPATMPAKALTYALNLGPDAIFLLSDGELQDQSQFMLRRANGFVARRKQTPIHTIHLFSLEGRRTLKMIALENSGTFTPINGG